MRLVSSRGEISSGGISSEIKRRNELKTAKKRQRDEKGSPDTIPLFRV